jgi:hypothetical protein
MAQQSPTRRRNVPGAHERATVAAIARHRPDDTQALEEARLALRVSRAEDYVKKLVDEAPPLTDAQRDRLAALLRAPSDGPAA